MHPIISYKEARETFSPGQLQAIGNSLDRIARKGYDAETPAFSSETARNSRNFYAYAKQARGDRAKKK